MIEILNKLFNRSNSNTDSDLTPRGVARTVSYLKTDFNSTFQHISAESKNIYKSNRLP